MSSVQAATGAPSMANARRVTISPTTGKLRGPRIVIGDPAKRRSKPPAYVPGQYDGILAVRDHLDSAELTGCSVDLSADRSAITITEHGVARSPRHRLNGEPCYIDFAMADGSSVQVEIRRFAAAAIDPGEPAVDGDDTLVCPSPRTAADILLIGVSTNHG